MMTAKMFDLRSVAVTFVMLLELCKNSMKFLNSSDLRNIVRRILFVVQPEKSVLAKDSEIPILHFYASMKLFTQPVTYTICVKIIDFS